MNFKDLHHQEQPVLIGNVWDVPSTKIAEKLNFQAIGTSSAAIAKLLGYNDGEEMKFSEMEYMVQQISLHTKIPLSVDLEAGYSRNASEIVHHIKRLAALGVVGINIEDSIVNDKRVLLDAEQFANTISEIKKQLQEEQIAIFVNVRTDTFILQTANMLTETKRRIQLYEHAGADGIFVPCIENAQDIKEIVTCTRLPLNVMCMPKLPNFDNLAALGVKRISMGNFLFDNMYQQLENTTETILKQHSFTSIF
ncbi:carboxyvinyl-carboxyphosphonate phosphorylmutase [Kordia sp. SMS9]|uniref:isocitrate lyase/PEP mutase family protein n=1 Tax=Kordia sp. SMS9 TaxID=2282170 RepID=UPI000E0DE322|nr:isocitrate lyase/phosphoenolpyruvate mutase family protein [Kordia sp. SMS9]AXG72051.1 carboxyvinyl-carboxyphosphonate phosphorylmutase [Kordia sp. SMS9]